MSKKIIGVTVGTPISPAKIENDLKTKDVECNKVIANSAEFGRDDKTTIDEYGTLITPEILVRNKVYVGDNDEVTISSGGIYLAEGASLHIGGEDVIGDIEQALDDILAIQKELMPSAVIDFTINWGDIYSLKAIEGMTWGEWIDSEYNTIDMYDSGGSPYVGVSGLNDANYNWQVIDDVIIANMTYTAS